MDNQGQIYQMQTNSSACFGEYAKPGNVARFLWVKWYLLI